MALAERPARINRNLTDYLFEAERAMAYGFTELGISTPALLGSLYAMHALDSSYSESNPGILIGLYMFTTTLSICLSGLGVVDGVINTRQGKEQLEVARNQINEGKFKIRGFFLNRTVVTA